MLSIIFHSSRRPFRLGVVDSELLTSSRREISMAANQWHYSGIVENLNQLSDMLERLQQQSSRRRAGRYEPTRMSAEFWNVSYRMLALSTHPDFVHSKNPAQALTVINETFFIDHPYHVIAVTRRGISPNPMMFALCANGGGSHLGPNI